MSDEVLDAGAFRAPAILLAGTVDYAMYNSFREQLGRASANGLVVVELSTLGGDPEVARMMGEMFATTVNSILIGTSYSLAKPPSIRRVRPSCRSLLGVTGI